MNILLVCAMGMSTSILVSKMKEETKKQGKDYKIWAIDIDSLEDEDELYDIVLLGPQVSFKIKEVEETVNPGIPVRIINKVDYGTCNGSAVLKFAEEQARK